MTQPTKKPASAQSQAKSAFATSKISESIIKMAKPMEKAQEKAFKIGCENEKNLMHTAESFSRVANECVGACSGNIEALIESGTVASAALQELGAEITECCNRTFSDFSELSQEAMACRTVNDMIELQGKMVQQVVENYFNMTNKLCGVLFESFNEALKPLHERASEASEQICKAMKA